MNECCEKYIRQTGYFKRLGFAVRLVRLASLMLLVLTIKCPNKGYRTVSQ